MNTPVISVNNLSKMYKLYSRPLDRLKESLWPKIKLHTQYYALSDVSFEIQRGEHLGVIGVNGAGKSTLLQILTGVLTPSSGSVEVRGRVAALLELGAGFNPEMTGRENVEFLTALVVEEEIIPGIIEKIIDFAQIGDYIDQPVKLYSSGMFARLAFAMNISHAPDILIVDEALAVGDVFFQQKCIRKMKEYKQYGTVLFVSHDTASVMDLCKNAIWLENGKIKEFGPAKDVCEHYLASSYTSTFAQVESIKEISNNVDTVCDDSEAINEVHDKSDAVFSHFFELKSNPVSDFEDKEFFGTRDATILRCTIRNLTRNSVVFGPDDLCQLCLYFVSNIDISNVIAGFILKDRLGKAIYGTNSYRYNTNMRCRAKKIYAVLFEFVLPNLMSSEYIVTLAIAEGALDIHRQLHWIHDAATLSFCSHTNDGTVVAAHCNVCSLLGGYDVE